MSASKQDIKDLQTIANEIYLLKNVFSKFPEEYRNYFDNDIDQMTAILQSEQNAKQPPQSQRQYFLSSKAQQTISDIAVRQSKSCKNATVREYIQEIKEALYLHLIDNREFNQSNCSKLISKVKNNINNRYKNITYYIPFEAPSFGKENELKIGNIKIIHKDTIFQKIKDDKYYDSFIGTDKQEKYNCLIKIPISDHSQELSEIKAKSISEIIYGIVKVFTTSYGFDANYLSLQNHPINNNIVHYITKKDDQYAINGSYSFGEDLKIFWENFEEDLKGDLGLIIEKLILRASSNNSNELLADRLLDAFYWFGDASRDTNKNAQVVKLVTAIERLVTIKKTDKNETITENFSLRTSCLVSIFSGEIGKWSYQAKSMYKLRSDLVHGSRSIFNNTDLGLDFDPFQITYQTILSACVAFYKLGLELSSYEKNLVNMYDELLEVCETKEIKR